MWVSESVSQWVSESGSQSSSKLGNQSASQRRNSVHNRYLFLAGLHISEKDSFSIEKESLSESDITDDQIITAHPQYDTGQCVCVCVLGCALACVYASYIGRGAIYVCVHVSIVCLFLSLFIAFAQQINTKTFFLFRNRFQCGVPSSTNQTWIR